MVMPGITIEIKLHVRMHKVKTKRWTRRTTPQSMGEPHPGGEEMPRQHTDTTPPMSTWASCTMTSRFASSKALEDTDVDTHENEKVQPEE